MGRYYALHDGEDRLGRRRHPRPLRAEGADRRRCPTAPVSIAVALADKLDQLAGFFAIGETADRRRRSLCAAPRRPRHHPHHPRERAAAELSLLDKRSLPRQAAGDGAGLSDNQVVRALNAHPGAVALVEQCRQAVTRPVPGPTRTSIYWHSKSWSFSPSACASSCAPRARGTTCWLRCSPPAPTTTSTVCSRAPRRSRSASGTEDGANLLTAYRRAANILRIEERKDGPYRCDPDRGAARADPAGKALASALHHAAPGDRAAHRGRGLCRRDGDMAQLRAPLDAFFDKVTVNAPEPRIAPQSFASARPGARHDGPRRRFLENRRLNGAPDRHDQMGVQLRRRPQRRPRRHARTCSAARAPTWRRWPRIGLPVPPGFTITTEVCTAFYENDRQLSGRSRGTGRAALAHDRRSGRPALRRPAEAAAGLGPLRRARLDARHDGHGAQSRPERRDGGGAGERMPATPASPGTAIAASSRCTARSCSASITTGSRRSSSTPSWNAGVTEDTALTAEDWHRVVAGYKDMVEPGDRQAVPAGPAGAALGRDRRGVRLAG